MTKNKTLSWKCGFPHTHTHTGTSESQAQIGRKLNLKQKWKEKLTRRRDLN